MLAIVKMLTIKKLLCLNIYIYIYIYIMLSCLIQVFAIDMGRLVAGASCRGEFEERVTQLVDEVKQSDGSIILFIDEVHTLIGAGSGRGALDAANMLKPALARGELKVVLLFFSNGMWHGVKFNMFTFFFWYFLFL